MKPKVKTKGLLCNVYTDGGVDCTAGGISSKNFTKGVKNLILTEDHRFGYVKKIDAPFNGDESNSVIIKNGAVENYFIVVSQFPPETTKQMCGPMFGGNFLYSSDSRFPFKYPLPIHDRWETWEAYNHLSI